MPCVFSECNYKEATSNMRTCKHTYAHTRISVNFNQTDSHTHKHTHTHAGRTDGHLTSTAKRRRLVALRSCAATAQSAFCCGAKRHEIVTEMASSSGRRQRRRYGVGANVAVTVDVAARRYRCFC